MTVNNVEENVVIEYSFVAVISRLTKAFKNRLENSRI